MIRVTTMSLNVAALFLVAASPACESRGLLADAWCSATNMEQTTSSTAAPTYYRDVAPILDARCTLCHAPGGPGGYDLTRAEVALSIAPLIRAEVKAKLMPPWPPEQCCTKYQFSRALSDEERATIEAWAASGAPPGDPADLPQIMPPVAPGLSRVDRTLSMPEPYQPKVATDNINEQRCFLVDWPSDQVEYVTGLNVRPLRADLVHHVIVYVASEDQVDYLRELDDADDGPGWNCYGGVGNRVSAGLGGWAPGFRGVDFPAGTGHEIEPGSKIVIEVHYHFHDGSTPGADQTAVDVSVAPAIEKKAKTVLVIHPQWLVGDGMRIEAGETDAAYGVRYDPTPYYDGDSMTLYNVTLHMHALGTHGRVLLAHADGSTECLIEISRWDYNWQGEYWFVEPKKLHSGDRIYLECHWNNTSGRELEWGTDGEMCMATLYAVPE